MKTFSRSPIPNTKTNDVAYMVVDRNELYSAYTDLIGRFPCKSSSGNEYVLVAYHYNSNCIIARALKIRKSVTITIINTWKDVHTRYTQAVVAPNTYIMTNEISTKFIAVLIENGTEYQIFLSHTHRRNLTEWDIQNFNTNFKAVLASVDPNFPLSEWDRLIKQANITLNLLRSARSNPNISAYTYMFG